MEFDSELRHRLDDHPPFAFCESVGASGRSPWHIRPLGPAGLKPGGGIDTPPLCKRFTGGWDLLVKIRPAHFKQQKDERRIVCPKCQDEYLALITKREPEVDRAWRYAPQQVTVHADDRLLWLNVESYVAYPPGKHPSECPIEQTLWALQMRSGTLHFYSRWWGFEEAKINSELRMIVRGFSSNDEVRMKWDLVPEDKIT